MSSTIKQMIVKNVVIYRMAEDAHSRSSLHLGAGLWFATLP